MKKFFAVLTFFVFAALAPAFSETHPRDFLWKDVSAKMKDGRPKDAMETLDEIAAQAAQVQAWGEYAAAVDERIRMCASLEGNDAEASAVRDSRNALENAPSPEARAFLAARLAYALYDFAKRRDFGRMHAQTPTEAETEANAPIETWSRERAFDEALSAYSSVFEDADLLKKIPIATFAAQSIRLEENAKAREVGIFSLHDSPEKEFPTLYDFFAQDAVKFYRMFESHAGNAKNRAEKLSEELLLGWKDFHANDADKSAYARAVFTELNTKNEFDETGTKNFVKEFSYYPIAAEAFEALAKNALREERNAEAFLFAKEGFEKYKNKKDSNVSGCARILNELQAQYILHFRTSELWFDAESAQITVEAQNIEKLHFRAVPWDWQDFLRRERNRPENLSAAERKEIVLSENDAITWSQELEKFTDFAQHQFTVPAPFEKFEPGFYFVCVSADPEFKSFGSSAISYLTVWISNLAVVTKQMERRDNAKQERTLRGYVVNATTGEPLENVEIAAWNKVYGGDRVPVESVQTKADGTFEISGLKSDFVALAVAPDGNAVEIQNPIYGFNPLKNSQTQKRVNIGKLFTDRPIYRPGQLIHFKGICAQRITNVPGSGEVIPGEKIKVYLKDTNNRIVAETECYTNAFGSFAGTFTAPAGLLNGNFQIEFGDVRKSIRVEEYKRPKFELELKSAAQQQILGQTVSVKASAKTLNGLPLGGAQIEWSVSEGRKNIATGKGILDADGTFKIAFPTEVKKLTEAETKKLSPTEKQKRELKLSRFYDLKIAVTDSTGETQTYSKWFPVGNRALNAEIRPKTNDEFCLSVSPRSFYTEKFSVPVKLEVYEHVLPEKIARKQSGGAKGYRIEEPEKRGTRGKKLFEKTLSVSVNGNDENLARIPDGVLPKSGSFIAVVSGKDAFAKPFSAECSFEKLDPSATCCPVKLPFILQATNAASVAVGETFSVLWGSGYGTAHARVEIFKNGEFLNAFWTEPTHTQQEIKIPVTRDLIGGFSVQISQFRDGDFYTRSFNVSVPEPDKELKIKWERFRTKLVPGGAEVWTARVTLPDGTPANAEMLALLYDRSLDKFAQMNSPFCKFSLNDFSWSNRQPINFGVTQIHSPLSGEIFPKTPYLKFAFPNRKSIDWLYPPRETFAKRAYGFGGGKSGAVMTMASATMFDAAMPQIAGEAKNETIPTRKVVSLEGKTTPVSPRKNLQETAFFQPFINTDANGIAQITFVVPEALTGWRFMAFAHDKSLRSGTLFSSEIVTEKPLMVQPNPPRFLREGDLIDFPVKITNTSKTTLEGKIQLALNRADDLCDVFAELCGGTRERVFSVPAGTSKTITWKIRVPENCGFLTYRATAHAEEFSDGEEALLPILPKTVPVTESANFVVAPESTRRAALFSNADFNEKKFKSLSVEINENPAWNAALALPKLAMLARETDSSDSIFYRLYTNKIAEFIANSDPAIRRKFETLVVAGNNSKTLTSPLAREKSNRIAIESTPYIRDADDETAQRRNIAVLFDKNTMAQETLRALATLRERLSDLHGDGWSWFPGAQKISPTTTRTILIGLARLRNIGALPENETAFARSAIASQDEWLKKCYDRFDEKGERKPAEFSPEIAEYLYMRSQYNKPDIATGKSANAWNYYLSRAKKSETWTQLPRAAQGQIALAIAKIESESDVPARIVESLRQHAVKSNELGMYWKNTQAFSLACAQSSAIETHALMIEVFAEIARDETELAQLKMWLLTQKQANAWRASRATAEAVFALLCTTPKMRTNDAATLTEAEMRNVPASTAVPKVTVGTHLVPADGKHFAGNEIVPALAQLEMKNPGENPIFVSAIWNYDVPVEKVRENTPPSGFKLRKTLWKKAPSDNGTPTLFPIRPNETLASGDEIVVRLVIEADRDFEFVHLKDLRGSGCESTGTRSGYRSNNGVWYYATTRDTAEEFFFDRLPRGKHVFEYALRVVHRGVYSAGFAEIRSLYAPEFSAHSKAAQISTR